jgi:NAD(P)-dependent dehydrogenase (short-subunit alcohol dehydrogenase family)
VALVEILHCIARHGGDVIITYRNGKEAADAVAAEISPLVVRQSHFNWT